MTRVLVHVEGETEEAFVNEVLSDHLVRYGYSSVAARLLGNARARAQRGGIRAWPAVRRDIVAHLKEDTGSVGTTMVDYYGLPKRGPGAWPGRDESSARAPSARAQSVEMAMQADIRAAMGGAFDARRFVPFVVMHEFEALLFSDCDMFATAIGRPEVASDLRSVRMEFATPEEIDDSPESAPSKRVLRIVRGYQKPFMGNLAMLEIGLDKVRAECRHFDHWLTRMERLLSELGGSDP